MSKRQKINNLGMKIMIESEKVEVLLEQILSNDDIIPQIRVLVEIALEKSRKIAILNEKIGKYSGR